MQKIHISIVSDFICPWCYIGKSRLHRLQKNLASEIDMEFEMLPFQLYPAIPKEGADKSLFAKRTKPGMGRSLRAEAAEEGIDLNYDLIERIPNSLEAHRLMYLASDYNDLMELSLRVFRVYFNFGIDIGSPTQLIESLVSSGIEEGVFETFLTSEIGKEEVDFLIQQSKERHIRSVPAITLNHRFQIPGLQSYEVMEKYIRRAVALVGH